MTTTQMIPTRSRIAAAALFLAIAAAGLTSLPLKAAAQTQADVLAGRALPPITTIPAPKPTGETPLYPQAKATGPDEQWAIYAGGRIVRNVVTPTITPILPDPAKATGAAVIVAPGGAFLYLGMDGESYDVARRLADNGVAAFVLKYRTNPTPRDSQEFLRGLFKLLGERVREQASGTTTAVTAPAAAVEDAQAAVRLVRARAGEWGVDPTRVGFIGFSAGAMTAVQVGFSADAAARPDFIASMYGPAEVGVAPAYAPPLFAAMAMDDPLFAASTGGLVPIWSKARRPVEAHFYERGGHGFAKGTTSEAWFDQLLLWMKMRGYLSARS